MVQLDSSPLTPTRTRNLVVMFDDQFTTHISTKAWSCKLMLYNIRKTRLFVLGTSKSSLPKHLSFLKWTTAVLYWPVFHSAHIRLCRWSTTWQHICSSINQRGSMPYFSWFHSTVFLLLPTSDSSIWYWLWELQLEMEPPTSKFPSAI